jgi:hypothetical protein
MRAIRLFCREEDCSNWQTKYLIHNKNITIVIFFLCIKIFLTIYKEWNTI